MACKVARRSLCGIALDSTALCRAVLRTCLHNSAEFAVHVYHGTLLYYEGHMEESLPLIRIAADAFPAITAKNLETLLPFVETEHLEYLQQIHDAVVDLNQHSQFALIEPNRENH